MTAAAIMAGIERLLRGILALVLFSMMALVFVDVIARYVFNDPIPGAFEITQLLMGLLVFSGLPLASRAGQHITISLMDGLFHGRARVLRRAAIETLSGAALLGLAWLLWRDAEKARGWGDYTAFLEIPLHPVLYFIALMSLLAALLTFARAIAGVRAGPLGPGGGEGM